MDRVQDISVAPLKASQYIKPMRVSYTQVTHAEHLSDIFLKINGIQKTWDVMKNHDSVAILIHNVSREVLVFVRQFRPAVYINRSEMVKDGNIQTINSQTFPPGLGITYELCAGIVDKEKPLPEIAHEEVLEETGYKAPLEIFERITSFRSGVGVSGSLQTMYYVAVTDDMKVSAGGGNPEEGEFIELTEVPTSDCIKLAMDETVTRPVGFSFALLWFYHNKLSKK